MILSATPVSLNYGYDNNVNINNGEVYTYDGVAYVDSSLLSNSIDVSVNNNELLLLTKQTKLNHNIKPVYAPSSETYIYSTLLKDYLGNYLYATDPLNPNGSNLSVISDVTSATVFNFYFPSTPDTVQIYYTIPYNNTNINLYLICNTGVNAISSGVLDGIDPVCSTYYYTLNNSTFSFITNAPGLKTQWLVSYVTSYSTPYLYFVGLSATTANNLTVPPSATFYAVSLNNSNFNNALQSQGQSDLIKYLNVDNQINVASGGNIDAPFNYLISSAFKNLTTDSSSISANINILKNYYSPMHNQGVINNAPLRDYNKIYTGLNENIGSEKIYLGYNASTSKIIFDKDKDTYFHYPVSAANITLSGSTLADSGSRADVSPWRSDRLFKKIADYKKYSSWGDSLNSIQNGVYFCSWLSAGTVGANTTVKPVWMDRYFNPALVNKTGISYNDISALSGVLTDSINNYPNLIWDIPSTMTFNPGVLYQYHRIGENDNNNIVQSISGLTYHVTNWENNLINDVTGLTAGSIAGYTTNNTSIDSNLKVPYYNTNNTYGYVNTANSDFTNTQGTTLSFYAYQKDWTNITGDQIAGNYFNGGIGLFNNNPILTPYFTVSTYTLTGGAVQTYNSNLNLISSNVYNTYSGFTTNSTLSAWLTPAFVLKNTYDNSYFVVDNNLPTGNNYLSTFDPSDLLINKASLSGSIPYLPLSSIIVDAYSVPASAGSVNIVVKTHPDTHSVTYRRFNSVGTLLVSATSTDSTTTSMYNNFVVDLSGNPIWYNTNIPNTRSAVVSGYEMWVGTNACVNSINDVFSLSGNGNESVVANVWVIAKNSVPLLTVNSPEYINCDQDDYLWVTYNTNYLMKVDSYGKVIWTKQINTGNSIISQKNIRAVNFLAENTQAGIKYYTLVIDGKSQYIYKIDSSGNVVNSVSVPGLMPGGDNTGFNYQRKYIAPTLTVPGIQAKLVTCDTTVVNPVPNYITLNHGTSALSPGWHNFTITFDQTNTAKLYVDGTVSEKAKIVTPLPSQGFPFADVTLSINGKNYPNNSIINVASNTPIDAYVCGTVTGAFLQAISSDTSPTGNSNDWTVWFQQLYGPPALSLLSTGCGTSAPASKSFTGPYTLYIRALVSDTQGRYPGYPGAPVYPVTVTVKWAAPGAPVPANIIPVPNMLPSVLYSVYNYKNNPQLVIGTSSFKTGTLNEWLKSPTSYLFNGGIADLRLYDIALTDSDIKAISKNSTVNQFNDLTWNIPTGNRSYIEEIERFFLHRLPGFKSQFYNIKIKNSSITDLKVRSIVESNLRTAAVNIAPAYAQLRSIIWE